MIIDGTVYDIDELTAEINRNWPDPVITATNDVLIHIDDVRNAYNTLKQVLEEAATDQTRRIASALSRLERRLTSAQNKLTNAPRDNRTGILAQVTDEVNSIISEMNALQNEYFLPHPSFPINEISIAVQG